MKPLRLVAPHLPRALCAHYEPNIWFPERPPGIKPKSYGAHAKAICNGTRPGTIPCPELEACLLWALAMDERDGIWAGLDAEERAALTEQAS